MSHYSARLDLDRLAELRDLDEAYVEQAIGRFLARAVADLAAMKAAALADDRTQLGMVAHRLAGAALNLGAGGLGRAALAVDELAILGTEDMVAGALQQLAEDLSADVEALATYRRELGALPA